MVSALTAKGISILILFVLTVVFGWLPVTLHRRGILTRTGTRRQRLVLDLLNCLAGGVFLGVCLLHLLSEGREDFEEYKEMVHFDSDFPFFETVAGAGLFLIAAVEKIGFALISFFRRTSPTIGSKHSDTAQNDQEQRAAGGGAQTAAGGNVGSSTLQASTASGFHTMPEFSPVTVATKGGARTYGAISASEADRPPAQNPVDDQPTPTSETDPLLMVSGRPSEGDGAPVRRAPKTMDDLFARPAPAAGKDDGSRLSSSMTLPPRAKSEPNGCQNLTSSLGRRSRSAAPGGVSEGDAAPGGMADPEQAAMNGQEEHHHHHHSLVASTSCQPQDISELSVIRALLLLLALSFHTVFDGLAVGLQDTAAKVWEILAGVAVHKVVVAFCLGLDLAATCPQHRGLRRPLLFMLFFALVAPVGTAVGMGVTSGKMDVLAQLLASSILQAVATGTFLYVTFFEILGQQFAHSHRTGATFLGEGLAKVACALVGFACMAGVKLLN